MHLCEIFHSLQGEGSLEGVPSVFIRTSGCNLRCAWCDTPYASWEPEGRLWDLDAIVAEVQRYPAAHVVLTGGEPMIANGIHALAAELRLLGYHLTLETAGTVAPGGIACDLASLSPKLLHSAPSSTEHPAWHRRHEATRWKPEIVREWLSSYDYQLKFVVATRADIEEIAGMLEKLGPGLPAHRVLLMPEAREAETQRQRSSWLAEECLRKGYRYAHRLHLSLWGNRRGV